jgi:hypothetical protein
LQESPINGPARMQRRAHRARNLEQEAREMKRDPRVLAAAGSVSLALLAADAALVQKSGGILKIGHFASPASMSPLEESTVAVNRPMMGVFKA